MARHRESPQRALRADIQGLRAVAVSAVLVYHLWPGRVTGGFVGVDVFFVISGFLITAHLLAAPPRRPVDLLAFWSRRIRRLLPASLLVLAAVLVASRLIAPETQWANTATQVKAAALYVVNWRLAGDAVDYLAAENAPSPVQHFWSLSVEEQFYLGWPVLLLVLGLVAVALRRRAAIVVPAGLAVVVAVSFAYSVRLTASDPARAYFVTGTRIWELGAGGLLAAAVAIRKDSGEHPAAWRGGVAWLGLVLVAVAVFGYDAATPFPGWRAALPVVGTVLVIAARCAQTGWSPGRLLALRPVQWLGDVSYSVYLWHWPLIVLLPAVSGDRLGLLDKVAIVVATLLLAQLTKVLVEDRFRAARWGRPLPKPFALAAVAMAAVVGASLLQTTESEHRVEDARRASDSALTADRPCFGAPALGRTDCPPARTLTPTPVAAAEDKSHAYASVSGGPDCFAASPSFPDVRCEFGERSGDVRVAVVGNSHAGQWVDAIDAVARAAGWRMTTYLASRCAFATTPQRFATDGQTAACRRWVARTTDALTAARYDLVIMTNRISLPAVGASTVAATRTAYRDGYGAVVAAIRASGARLVGIRDTPAPGDSVPDCLAAHPDSYRRCDGTRAAWLPAEPLVDTLRERADTGARLLDLTDRICMPRVCPAVIGGVPVYFDGSHLTSTFSRTLARYLTAPLTAAVRA